MQFHRLGNQSFSFFVNYLIMFNKTLNPVLCMNKKAGDLWHSCQWGSMPSELNPPKQL